MVVILGSKNPRRSLFFLMKKCHLLYTKVRYYYSYNNVNVLHFLWIFIQRDGKRQLGASCPLDNNN